MSMPLNAVSLARLMTCDIELQKVVKAVAVDRDVLVICGFRGRLDQEAAYKTGASRDHWPNSRHNSYPAQAVDIAPLPLDWHDLQSFNDLAGAMKTKAAELAVDLEWGGDWPHLQDRPHYQLRKQKA